MAIVARELTPHLMFDGVADEAMRFYVSFFADSDILETERYGPDEQGAEGTIKRAMFTIGGQRFMCIDSPVKHAFTFTPSVSIYIECESDAELQDAFDQLSAGGGVLMPLDDYGFSARFGWITDRFGVSWQVNLP